MLSRDDLARLDAADPLAGVRDRFALPAGPRLGGPPVGGPRLRGLIYLDGNSLGALPARTAERVADVIEREWGGGLIRSWNTAGWIELPLRVGDKIARLIGARPGEVAVADSTSVNLFKVLACALALAGDRRVVLSEAGNFPTDLYIMDGLTEMLGGRCEVRLEPAELIASAIDEDVAVVALTHVSYRSGAMHDIAAITARAHERGALAVWDLAHSAGAIPIDLEAAGADFAVGCGYKYLNGGPGAPAFVYCAERHQAGARQPLSGWLGHAEPFAFEERFRPAAGIARFLCGTPPILSLAALEVGVDLLLECDLEEVRRKSVRMTDLLIELVEARCAAHPLGLVTPRRAAERGSQVSLRHPDGYAVMQALIARGVIGDFRAPDILRFGVAPLYLRYVDLWDAVDVLADVLDSRAWDRPEFRARLAVT